MCKESIKGLARKSGDVSFAELSPGEPAARNRPMYSFFEAGTFSKPIYIHAKFAQVEDHLRYFLLRQRRRQDNQNVSIRDIVAVSGVATTLKWDTLKRSMGLVGHLDHGKYPLCNELAQQGRLLVITVDDPFVTTVNLEEGQRESTLSGMTKLMVVTKAVSGISEKLEELKMRNDKRLDVMEEQLNSIKESLTRLMELGGHR